MPKLRHRVGIENILKKIFPVCFKLTGPAVFSSLVSDYRQKVTLPTFDAFDAIGESFLTVIAEFLPPSGVPYLVDLARFELGRFRIFAAQQATHLNFEKLAACYNTMHEKIIFTMSNTCFLLRSQYPVQQIWQAGQAESVDLAHLAFSSKQEFYFLVWRNQAEMQIACLAAEEWHTLAWIRAGITCKELHKNLKANFPHIMLSEILPYFIQKKWITGFTVAPGT